MWKVDLRSVLRATTSPPLQLMIVDVIASPDLSSDELFINRGSDDGLSVGQYVLGDNSVIGRISEISQRTARVMLVTDKASKIAVNIDGLDLQRLMRGVGYGQAKIELVPLKKKVKVGDKVKVCKQAGLLDSAMVAGVVSECKRDSSNPSLWDITVEPVCDIANLRSLLWVLSR